jgi:hypothetical protein
MKIRIAVVFVALALGGCLGPEGNPNGQAYATDPGGAIAVKPQVLGEATYDPYGKAAPFADMTAGQAAIAPSATPPLNLTTQGQTAPAQAQAPMPQPQH